MTNEERDRRKTGWPVQIEQRKFAKSRYKLKGSGFG